ncbi:MAG: histidinol-phosphate transaminase [Actinobacteria bacterium]|nr:histidinol-phosphate transaminase [Actinomycetota bacterium]
MAIYPKRDDLRELSGYHSPQVSVKVRLNTNESPIAPPTDFVEAVSAAVREVQWNRYPDRTATALRQDIAALHGVSADNVFVANGSNEVLQSLLLAYSGAGRKVVTFEPTYQLHSHIARIAGATVVSGQRNADFTLDAAEVRRVCAEHEPSVTFLCSPNNPTGLAESPDVVRAAIESTPGIVLVDEAYAQFSPHSALELVREDARVAVSRTYSKTWSMAAARLGYLIAPTWMIADLEIVALPYRLDALKQAAGRAALRHVTQMEAAVREVVTQRERLVAAMAKLPLTVWPSEANFILFRPAGAGGAGAGAGGAAAGAGSGTPAGTGRALWQALLDQSVLVRDCSSWQGLTDCLRVTVGTAEENDAFLAALQSALPVALQSALQARD